MYFMERFLWELIIWNSALLKAEFQGAGWGQPQVTVPSSTCYALEGHISGRHPAAASGLYMGGSSVHMSPWSRIVPEALCLGSTSALLPSAVWPWTSHLTSFHSISSTEKWGQKQCLLHGITMRINWVHVHKIPRIGQTCLLYMLIMVGVVHAY